MLSCKVARVNKAFLRLMCSYGGALDGWTEFSQWLLVPASPIKFCLGLAGMSISGCHILRVMEGITIAGKKKNTSTICHSLSLEWSWRTNSKLRLDQKPSSRVTVKMNQNQTKWEAFWNGKGRVTSQKFESEDLYCYIAYLTICTKNYRRSEASLSLTFSQGFHIKVKPQGSALTSTFTFPTIFHDGFYAKEGLQNKLKVKLKKLGVY